MPTTQDFFFKNKQTNKSTKPQPSRASLNRVFLYASKKFGHFSVMSFWPCLCPSAGWGEEIPKEGQIEIFPVAGAVWLFQRIAWDKLKPYQPFRGCRNSVVEYPVKRKVFWFPLKVQIPPVDVFLSRQKFLRGKKKNSLPKFSSWLLLLMWAGGMRFFIANKDVTSYFIMKLSFDCGNVTNSSTDLTLAK